MDRVRSLSPEADGTSRRADALAFEYTNVFALATQCYEFVDLEEDEDAKRGTFSSSAFEAARRKTTLTDNEERRRALEWTCRTALEGLPSHWAELEEAETRRVSRFISDVFLSLDGQRLYNASSDKEPAVRCYPNRVLFLLGLLV